MTTLVELDSRGVDGLKGDELLPEVIWFQVVGDMGPLPAAPHIEPFDDEPWRQLPQIEELVHLWNHSPISYMIHSLVVNMPIDDVPAFLAQQRFLAQIELDLIKERQAQDVAEGADDAGTAGEVAGVVPAAALGGGGDVPGESENGDQVESDGEAEGGPDAGRAQKVPRRRSPRKKG